MYRRRNGVPDDVLARCSSHERHDGRSNGPLDDAALAGLHERCRAFERDGLRTDRAWLGGMLLTYLALVEAAKHFFCARLATRRQAPDVCRQAMHLRPTRRSPVVPDRHSAWMLL